MTVLRAKFDTRREAEMTVERLVQEHEIDRGAVTVAPAGAENSAGDENAGSDRPAGSPTPPARADAALKGEIMVTADVPDDKVEKVRSAFREFDSEPA